MRLSARFLRARKGLAVCAVLALLFSISPSMLYANQWDDQARKALDEQWFGRGVSTFTEESYGELIIDKPTPFVVVSDISQIGDQVKDKIVLGEDAGETEYAEWQTQALFHGAKALLLCEPDRGKRRTYSRSSETPLLPFALLAPSGRDYLKEHPDELLYTQPPHQDAMNKYSSWGVSSDFVLHPDVIAPGTVYAPFSRRNYEDPAFGVLQGTSMSTPTVSGAIVLVKQFFKQHAPELQGPELVRAIHTQIQNTALAHRDKDLVLTSPRWQGAGALDVDLATDNFILISTPLNSEDTESGTGKVNLRDSIRPGGPSENQINFKLNLRNLGNEALTMKSVEAVLLVDKLNDGNKLGLGSKEVKRVALKRPTVPAKGETSMEVTVPFKDLLDGPMADIRKASPNGFFVEGFVLFEYVHPERKHTVELSVPFVGFYGDWMKIPVLERSIYDRTDPLDVPIYGRFSAVPQDGGGDHVTPTPRPYFNHFSGNVGDTEVVLGADWNFDFNDLKAVEPIERDDLSEIGTARVGEKYTPKNPAVRRDRIAVSLTGNGAKNLRLSSPAMRNWLVSKLTLTNANGELVLEGGRGDVQTNEKRYKDHGSHAGTSDSNVEDDNKVRRMTEFGSLDFSSFNSATLPDGKYRLRVQVRPDAFNLHNPVVAKDAQARGFDQYWETEDYDLFVDSLAPSHVRITSEGEGEDMTLHFTAQDQGTGVRGYRLLDQYENELAKSQDGTFSYKTEWGPVEKLKFEVADFAYNTVKGVVGNYLNEKDMGSVSVRTNAPASFHTDYYAQRKSDNKVFYDLQSLPAGEYYIYLLNPSPGFRAEQYSQEVTVTADETTSTEFSFVEDSSKTYALKLLTDRTFQSFEEVLPGLAGSTYELEFTDKTTHLRYIFPPNLKGRNEIYKSIQPGDYFFAMHGLRVWTGSERDYSSDKKNWKLGMQINDRYAYTSWYPRSDRPDSLESINTTSIGDQDLEFYFYVKINKEVLKPIFLPEGSQPKYVIGQPSFSFALHPERDQNTSQFRVKLPDRLSSDSELEELGLADSYRKSAEINNWTEGYFATSTESATNRTMVTITIPDTLQKKLQAGDKLIVQEMDEAWQPKPDNQLVISVEAAAGVAEDDDTSRGTIATDEGESDPSRAAASSDEEEGSLSRAEAATEEESEPSYSAAASTPLSSRERPKDKDETASQPSGNEPAFRSAPTEHGDELGDSEVYLRKNPKIRLNDRIGHRRAWARGYKGEGMLVAVVDNGLEMTHPSFQKAAVDPNNNKIASADALAKQVAAGRAENSMVRLPGRYINEKVPYAYNYFLESSDDESLMAGGTDEYEHGAHVSGIAVANPFYSDYPSDLPLFAGVAPEAQLAMMDIADSNGFKAESALKYPQAIIDAVALGADVVSVSMGDGVGTTNNVSTDFQKAIAYAESKGVPVVFAMGNDGYFGWVEPPRSIPDGVNPYLYDLHAQPNAENPDYGTMHTPGVFDRLITVGGYGADLFPHVDNALLNPELTEDGYTQPYAAAYRNHRIFLVSKEEEKQPVPESDDLKPVDSSPKPDVKLEAESSPFNGYGWQLGGSYPATSSETSETKQSPASEVPLPKKLEHRGLPKTGEEASWTLICAAGVSLILTAGLARRLLVRLRRRS